jgi:acetoin utilization protein AcuC
MRENMKNLVLIHSANYRNWVFSDTHPTQGRRFDNGRDLIVAACNQNGLDLSEREPRMATHAELETVHSASYVSKVVDEGKSEQWTGSRPELGELAATFVGGTLEALKALTDGETLTAVHLPGAKHHAQYDHSSGFCVFADLVIAAKTLTAQGKKVAVFDFDAHHGDGTENLSASDPNILTYSVHESGIFPGTGETSRPREKVYNRPLRAGDGNVQLLHATDEFIELAKEFHADYIFFAAGGDGHENDPLAHLRYTAEGAGTATKKIRDAFPATPMLLGGDRPDDDTPAMWCASVMGLITSGKSSRA